MLGHESQFSSKLRFWVGKIYLENGDKSLAEFLFKTQMKKSPLNYYSILSAAHLVDMNKGDYVEKIYLFNPEQNLSPFTFKESNKRNFPRLRLWLRANTDYIARLEISDILDPTGNLPSRSLASENIDLSFQILELFKKEQEYLKSFKFFNKNGLSKNFEFLPNATNILFPTPYQKLINTHSKGLDPILVYALIRQESAFNPRAISSAGARGLMQLMPNTARMYKKRLRKSDLYKPALNISIGTKYLKYLFEKYDKSLVHTLSSYNAGETNLRRWRKNNLLSGNDLINVESIPFTETRNYIKYISRNIFFYSLVFGRPMFKGLDWITKSI